jgi:hypothetical protein
VRALQRHLVDPANGEGVTEEGTVDWQRRARLVAAIVVVVAIIALAGMALANERTSTTVARPASSGTAAKAPRAAPRRVVAAPAVAQQPSIAPVVASVVAPPAATPPTPTAATPEAGAPAPPKAADPVPALPCPIPLPTPKATGGLASLVAIIPIFGPFSAEAFAMAPAYEPLLKAFGPFLPAFADALAQADPALTPVIDVIRQLEQQGYTALNPLYGPYRTGVLDAEAQLANALAPYTELIVSSPVASCIIDVEGLLAP